MPGKSLTSFTVFSTLMIASCGPKVPICVLLEDRTTEHCIPYDRAKPEYQRELEAGTFTYLPEDQAKLLKYMNDHCR